MKKLANNILKLKKVRSILIMIALVICLSIAGALYFRNYAKEVARPFDKALLAVGAVKKCVTTGSGFTEIDYRHPGYNSFYETTMNRDQAAEFINKVALENGFSLKHADAGDLPIPDMYIKNYYFDHSSKQNQFFPLKDGPTELTFALINSGNIKLSSLGCGTKQDVEVKNDDQHTAIRLDVKLPEVK